MPVVVVGFSFFFFDSFIGLLLFGGVFAGITEKLLTPVAPWVAIVLVVGIALLGAMTYAQSLGVAMKEKNPAWVLDHFLAPLVSIIIVFALIEPLIAALRWYVTVRAPQLGATLSGDIEGFVISIMALYVIFGAPWLAVSAMVCRKRSLRLLSYVGFMGTALTWGVVLIGLAQHKISSS